MKARDVMTVEVIAVRPGTPVREIAALLTERRISGVPVVADDGALLGMVSQSDLLHRGELGTEAKRKWWLAMLADADTQAREFTKAHGRRAIDVMTRHLVSVDADDELAEVAAILDRGRVSRVPVMSEGRMVGIITRSDLVKALAALPERRAAPMRSDGEIQSDILQRIRQEPWLSASYINVVVVGGRAQLWGYVGSADRRRALKALVEEIPGVTAVEDHLSIGDPSLVGV